MYSNIRSKMADMKGKHSYRKKGEGLQGNDVWGRELDGDRRL